ncbi:MAG: hypothetical protein LIO46_01575 [Clostridiales bacterium]|nr:hypothetical protein [Clostridiales bacterium]
MPLTLDEFNAQFMQETQKPDVPAAPDADKPRASQPVQEEPAEPELVTGKDVKALNVISTVLFVLAGIGLVFGILSFVLGLSENRYVLGFRAFSIEEQEPDLSYQAGDLILVRETEPNEIKTNDDIAYRPAANSAEVLISRVVEVPNAQEPDAVIEYFIRENANTSGEEEQLYAVSSELVIGVVQTQIPYAGWVVSWMNANLYWYAAGIIIAAMAAFQMRYILARQKRGETGEDA